MTHKIVCRARVVDECYHDTETRRQFDDDLPMNEDGTFDGESIICDPCYLAIQPFAPVDRATGSEDLVAALHTYRDNAKFLAEHADPTELVTEAEFAVSNSRVGSPVNRSASACLRMAQAEVERRTEAEDEEGGSMDYDEWRSNYDR